MKNVLFPVVIAIFIWTSGCAVDSQQTETAKTGNNAQPNVTKNDSPLVASSHQNRSAQAVEPKENSTNLPSSGSSSNVSPMMTGNATAIDMSEYDAKIVRAEKESKQKPKDEATKKVLGEAYAERAFALTEAAQYRAALGDFRRALKLDPSNAEAKQMHDQIIKIFKDLNREPPKEGEEPPPLPFKKA